MAKCNKCLHKYVCEMRTCAECVGGYCDECQLYDYSNGKPDIENCEDFINEEKPFNVVRCGKCIWYNEEKFICTNPHCTKSFYGCRVNENHFCSYGERKNDDG